ncbi:SOS response-associated peptidase family protein [Streptomyces sp. YGL11-2]|uniref:SOS response-associated peptidase family protein n=1 Tax=Streptomyces sp. YGL11-2 TaxID=3414028 RepID=UPI003CF1F6B0
MICLERDTGEVPRQLRQLRWGLVPSWAKSLSISTKMINARAEAVAEQSACRRAFAKRRACGMEWSARSRPLACDDWIR